MPESLLSLIFEFEFRADPEVWRSSVKIYNVRIEICGIEPHSLRTGI